MLSGLIFDFDGLILDTEVAIYQAWLAIFEEFGGRLSFSDYARGIGTAADAFDPVGYLQEQVSNSLDPIQVLKRQQVLSHEMIIGQPPLPGVLPLIEEAKRKAVKLAIASSSPREWVYGYLIQFGLLDRFDAVLCQEDAPLVKPDPGLYLAALRAINHPASHVIAFEDSPFGITAAQAAGLYCVAVPNRLTIQMDLSHANLVVRSMEEVTLDDLSHRLAARSNGSHNGHMA